MSWEVSAMKSGRSFCSIPIFARIAPDFGRCAVDFSYF